MAKSKNPRRKRVRKASAGAPAAPSSPPGAKPIGRPPKLVEDPRLIEVIGGLARIGCSIREAAAALSVNHQTLRTFLDAHEDSREAWEFGPDVMRASLRRRMWKASDGTGASAVRMQIWLSKQMLGHTEKVDTRLSDPDGKPLPLGVPSNVTIFQLPDNGRG